MDTLVDRRSLLALLMAFAAVRPSAGGQVDPALYRAVTIVTGTVEPERSRGFAACLREVLVKLTGEPALADAPGVAEAAARAGDFVAEHRYRDRMAGIPVHDEQGTRERPHFLTVSFAPEKIDALLGRLGRRPWRNRPVVLLEVDVDNGDRRFRLEQDGALGRDHRAALLEAADRLGLPVRFPPPGASKGEDAVLAGHLQWRADRLQWTSNWRLRSGSGGMEWRFDATSFDCVFRDALGRATARLAAAARR